MVKFHGFLKKKSVHKSVKPILTFACIEQPSHPVSFINQLPYVALVKNVHWLPISEQDIISPTSLTNELRLFFDYVKLDEQEEEARNILLHDVEATTQSVFPNAYIEAFGSFPVGLSTFLSDLDVTILGLDSTCDTAKLRARNADTHSYGGVKNSSSTSIRFRDEDDRVMRIFCLEQVYTAIQVHASFAFILCSSYVEHLLLYCQSCSWVHKTDLWRRARVPIIHLTHRNSVQCDVCIDIPQHSTVAVVQGLLERCGSSLLVLSAFLKIFLKQLSLDMPFTGGLGSYKLYVLIAKHIERHPEYVADRQTPQLGELLLSFLEFYGSRRNLHADTVVEMVGAETVSFERTSKVDEIRIAFEKAHSVLQDAEQRRQELVVPGSRRSSRFMLACLLNTAHLARLRNQLRARCHRYLSHRAMYNSPAHSDGADVGECEEARADMEGVEGGSVDRKEGEGSEYSEEGEDRERERVDRQGEEVNEGSFEGQAENYTVGQERKLALLKARLRYRIGRSKESRSFPLDATSVQQGAHIGGCSSSDGCADSSSEEYRDDSDTSLDEDSAGGFGILYRDSGPGQGQNREEREVSEYSDEGEVSEGSCDAESAVRTKTATKVDQERKLALLKARLRYRLGKSKKGRSQTAITSSGLPLQQASESAYLGGGSSAESSNRSDGELGDGSNPEPSVCRADEQEVIDLT